MHHPASILEYLSSSSLVGNWTEENPSNCAPAYQLITALYYWLRFGNLTRLRNKLISCLSNLCACVLLNLLCQPASISVPSRLFFSGYPIIAHVWNHLRPSNWRADRCFGEEYAIGTIMAHKVGRTMDRSTSKHLGKGVVEVVVNQKQIDSSNACIVWDLEMHSTNFTNQRYFC